MAQLGQLVAERRLAERQAFGRARRVALLIDDMEDPQQVEVLVVDIHLLNLTYRIFRLFES
ncbi:hypothetical protein D9M69_629730 [compost metagenome]